MFRVGQKIICIDDGEPPGAGPWDEWGPDEKLTVGAVYTVKRVLCDGDGDIILHLWEVARDARSVAECGPDVGYAAYRFRPAAERNTDISALTALLKTKRRANELCGNEP